MVVNISSEIEQRLRGHAEAAGYEDWEKFVADHLSALASRPVPSELQPMSDEDLKASVAMIEESMQQIERGEGMTVAEARDRTLAKLRSASNR